MVAVLGSAFQPRVAHAHGRAPVSSPHLRLAELEQVQQSSAPMYRRRRVMALVIVAAMVWLTVSTAMTLASWAVGTGAPVLPDTGEAVVHVVSSGDSVWSVAREYQPDGDVRPFVDRIIELNDGAELYVGQPLLLAP